MNLIDLILVGYVGFSLLRGFVRGFLVETGSILASLISIILSPRIYSSVEPFLPKRLHGNWGELVTFIVIFTVSLAITNLLLKLLTRAIPAVPLGCLNTVAGGVLGFVRSTVVCGIILAVLMKFPVAGIQKHISASKLAPKAIASSKAVYPFLPKEFRTQLQEEETGK